MCALCVCLLCFYVGELSESDEDEESDDDNDSESPVACHTDMSSVSEDVESSGELDSSGSLTDSDVEPSKVETPEEPLPHTSKSKKDATLPGEKSKKIKKHKKRKKEKGDSKKKKKSGDKKLKTKKLKSVK